MFAIRCCAHFTGPVQAGPTPLLPDYAFGTWFTFWSQYTEAEAKGEVERWRADDLPIDIWALDMNWRDTPHGHEPSCPDPAECERHYNCTATSPPF